ncbi:aminomethyltransferase family protein [Sedimentisphaera salicampi]|uniref:hypothetical protein n=1 Tax=Sedimentisphaera salicampi TaxID=1941349 RepID=UPI000B9A5EB7|nr:hypothetical protein [Sedimentisphaera salicampi]OXU14040.1 Aminomethyltransferase [Sedimentisphaera salicampi]
MLKISPLTELYERFGAVFSEYYGWNMPSDFPDFPSCEDALFKSNIAFDLTPFGRFEITGQGFNQFADKLAGEKLNSGECRFCKLSCGVVRILTAGGKTLVISHPANNQSVLNLLKDEASGSGAAVSDITENTAMFGLYGPKAYQAFSSLAPISLDLEREEADVISAMMMNFTVMRSSWIGSDGLEVICSNSLARMAASPIEKYHKKADIIPGSAGCLEKAAVKFMETFEE